MLTPYEQYETADSPIVQRLLREQPHSMWWTCWVCEQKICGADFAPGAKDRIIVRRDRKHRHERCGGPPAPDKPVVTAAEQRAKADANRQSHFGGGGKRYRRGKHTGGAAPTDY